MLITCQTPFAGRAQRIQGHALARRWHHHRKADLTPFVVPDPDHGHFRNSGMSHQHTLYFGGINVLAAGLVHLLDAVDDKIKSVLVLPCNIAGAEPAIAEVERRIAAEIARNNRRSLDPYLTRLAPRNVATRAIHEPHLNMHYPLSARTLAHLVEASGVKRGDGGSGLGAAVLNEEGDALGGISRAQALGQLRARKQHFA